jgi:hypothetical protein
VSCDLVSSEAGPENHIQADVLQLLDNGWDLMVAFPPCTYLTRANAWRWDTIREERQEALTFVRTLMDAPVPRIAIENPAGAIGTHIRPADQYVQPWWFGEPWQKLTGLWLKNLPKLVPWVSERPAGVVPYVQSGRRGYSGPGSVRRSIDRSRTFLGIARAMAEQWG